MLLHANLVMMAITLKELAANLVQLVVQPVLTVKPVKHALQATTLTQTPASVAINSTQIV